MISVSTRKSPRISCRITVTAHWLEWQWPDPILREPFQLKDGYVMVPDKPGEGIEWDEKAVAKFGH
jgi:mandelate racemase